MIKIKRVYDEASSDDGVRVLVDLLWPRGLRKEEAKIDLWMRQVAPSDELRKWFGHDPRRWEEFKRRYLDELRNNPAVKDLVELASNRDVTLLFSARDRERNNAVVLKEYVEEELKSRGKGLK
ncbi:MULTISPECIES: DUF488 domain-containing protein [Metallosphaera]|nr:MULTISPECIES: DUF488 domain-containing protein [Metallosphaera]AKV73948.1 uroporphyrin-III methyltransferase [Metallosphaera sedula]AKV76187.1 uroporphyrin-III methyltransferase [Metallosphaera sedula]AKV78439.1 uroporphyrin-III methyltransferase [Metallosphaera sedula]AKV80684.1 uroporphyrin-III methyltransferase [Metallosphaera sedula]AKV82925.1 uroporphyrin-III methyltransferase [Metallosphaera sedula]